MQLIVLIGGNIAHSRSPRLHNHLFERYALPYRYELMPLAVDEVVGALEMMKRGGYRGANVTSPHKRAVLPALDALSPEAGAIGAVNTIVIDDGRAVGHNTDTRGFEESIGDHPLLAAPFTANIIGTGGAAQAAAYVLKGMENLQQLTIYSRGADTGTSAAARWGDPRIHGRSLADYAPADLVIHATPLGLAGSSALPLDPAHLHGSRLLYEMIYSPAVTPLMQAARDRGIETIGGGRMFVGQALEAFRLWTGVEAAEEEVPILDF